MVVRVPRFALVLAATLLAVASTARAEGKPLHFALVMDDPARKASVHEAVAVALVKAGFDPADDDGIDPAAEDADLVLFSNKHSGEPVLRLTIEVAGHGFRLTAVAAAGATAHTEQSTARGKGLEAAAAQCATTAAVTVAGSSSNGELLGGPIGRLGVEIGASGLGVLALGYVPAVVLASTYGKDAPNASRVGVIPIFGAFTARTKLSDEILNDGASPGLIADGTIQLLGAAGFFTGAGLLVYAKVQQARAQSATAAAAPADPAVSVLPLVGPGFTGAEVALQW